MIRRDPIEIIAVAVPVLIEVAVVVMFIMMIVTWSAIVSGA